VTAIEGWIASLTAPSFDGASSDGPSFDGPSFDGRGWPEHLFSSETAPRRAEMETEDGRTITFPCSRWHRRADHTDLSVLSRCLDSVLDIGCGPGRHVSALIRQGRHAHGIDTSPTAVATAHRRGAPATHTSVFSAVPRSGRWDTALLLDGNIGIGGNIPRLLVRVRALLRPAGIALVETSAPLGLSMTAQVRVRPANGAAAGGWFPWAWTTPGDLESHATESGFSVAEIWSKGGRWFAELQALDDISQADVAKNQGDARGSR
jgi:SAM-dependent methyltransferase